MREITDLTGRVYGKMTVISRAENRGSAVCWNVKCECGKYSAVRYTHLSSGRAYSCSQQCCAKFKALERIGETHGRLTIEDVVMKEGDKQYRYICKCECGSMTNKSYRDLESRKNISCRELCENIFLAYDEIDKTYNRLTITGFDTEKSFAAKHILANARCVCGNVKTCRLKDIRAGFVASCGCLVKEHHATLAGEGNPNWKGGISPANAYLRETPEINEWKNHILKKYDRVCQACGIRRYESMHCHHIRNFAEETELRCDINNGILFCNECHLAFHSHFGKYGNNQDQVEEFTTTDLWKIKREKLEADRIAKGLSKIEMENVEHKSSVASHIGEKHGRIEIIGVRKVEKSGKDYTYCEIKCECGAEGLKSYQHIINADASLSCSWLCYSKSIAKEFINTKINKLTITAINDEATKANNNHLMVDVICECKRTKTLMLKELKRNKIKSCGCAAYGGAKVYPKTMIMNNKNLSV